MKVFWSIVLLIISMPLTLDAQLSIRLKPNVYDLYGKSIYYDVEIANPNMGAVSLADQNYRFYYNSKSLNFNAKESRIDLPQDRYSKLKLIESETGIPVNKTIGELSLSTRDEMGFANFFVQLLDTKEAGTIIDNKSGWVRVAVLKFDIVDETKGSLIVWGQSEVTNKIATAYVELMEWVAPNKTRPIPINQFTGAEFLGKTSGKSDYRIHPNPADDMVHFILPEAANEVIFFKAYDVKGQLLKNVKINRGISELTILTNDLPDGYYSVEIVGSNQVIHRDQLIIAH